jgi:oxygen-independent coproporphyrinogen-3 oxidase
MSEFTKAAVADLSTLLSATQDKINTVYIGGGTPTALPEDCLQALLEAIAPFVDEDIEYTCEANPDSLTIDKLSILKDFGINRLSIGVQSFMDRYLRKLGRLHDSQRAFDAYCNARDAGFGNISIDLIYGLPGQRTLDWIFDLFHAARLRPEHVSLYGLTIEKGTKFEERYIGGLYKTKLPEEDMVRGFYYTGIEMLESIGYKQYEISNFALPGFESRHNLNYWRHGKYFAVGPSASGFDGKRRWKNVSDTKIYIEAIKSGCTPIDEEEQLAIEQLISESLMLGLRLREGVNLRELSTAFNIDLKDLYSATIHSLEHIGMLEVDGDVIRLTREALFVSNSVISEFMLV